MTQLTACTPSVGTLAIEQRIADCIVGDANVIVCSELVLPVGITVGVGDGFNCIAGSTGGKGISGLAQDIAAAVIGIYLNKKSGYHLAR